MNDKIDEIKSKIDNLRLKAVENTLTRDQTLETFELVEDLYNEFDDLLEYVFEEIDIQDEEHDDRGECHQ